MTPVNSQHSHPDHIELPPRNPRITTSSPSPSLPEPISPRRMHAAAQSALKSKPVSLLNMDGDWDDQEPAPASSSSSRARSSFGVVAGGANDLGLGLRNGNANGNGHKNGSGSSGSGHNGRNRGSNGNGSSNGRSNVYPLTHAHAHDDLARTPPPKTFAPSPPISRTTSRTDMDLDADRINGGKYSQESDLARFLRTVDFAARKHSCQRRKDVDQTPYINHPIAVANFLSTTGITDVRVLQAAILHDTVEDTHTTIEEIANLFGTDVARIVEECTDDTNLSGLQRKVEQLRSAPHKSNEAKQVKLADKMHNLESIRRFPPVGWGIKRIQAYFIWAKQVTDVCASAHPPLAAQLQELYETAYTRVNGVYYPCHPDVCGPLTEAEKELVDSRLRCLKAGDTVPPAPIFF